MPKTEKKTKDPNAPKRPQSAYFLFMGVHRYVSISKIIWVRLRIIGIILEIILTFTSSDVSSTQGSCEGTSA